MPHKWKELKKKRFPEKEQQERIRQMMLEDLLELRLDELRQQLGVTQVQLAKFADMTQGELSRLERRDDHRLSTVRRYVEALGGKLEVTAIVGDKRVRLLNV